MFVGIEGFYGYLIGLCECVSGVLVLDDGVLYVIYIKIRENWDEGIDVVVFG